MQYFKQNKYKWAFYGALLSIGSPLGFYLLRLSPLADVPILEFTYLYNSIGTLLAFSFFGFWAGKLMDRFESIASHDTLTGLYSRRYMQKRLEEHFNLCRRHKLDFVVLMLDLDHFKTINDTFGHPTGDAVLQKTASAFKTTCRNTDIISRWGGEEFIILCPQTNHAQGLIAAERIRVSISLLDKSDLRIDTNLTISIGLSSIVPGKNTSLDNILKELDKVLYKAKHGGRNRVVGERLQEGSVDL